MAKTTKNTTAMTTISGTAPATALSAGLEALQNMGDSFSDEMGGLSATFEQIRIPIGGVTYFEVPGDDPEQVETVKEFSAVILHHHPMRAYYRDKYTGGNNPPDCGSFDAIEGTGTPGGDCEHCAFNQFGTGENGAKACKERRRLYLLMEGDVFPKVLSLPTGSLRDFSRYLTHCLPKWGNIAVAIALHGCDKNSNPCFDGYRLAPEVFRSRHSRDGLLPLFSHLRSQQRPFLLPAAFAPFRLHPW